MYHLKSRKLLRLRLSFETLGSILLIGAAFCVGIGIALETAGPDFEASTQTIQNGPEHNPSIDSLQLEKDLKSSVSQKNYADSEKEASAADFSSVGEAVGGAHETSADGLVTNSAVDAGNLNQDKPISDVELSAEQAWGLSSIAEQARAEPEAELLLLELRMQCPVGGAEAEGEAQPRLQKPKHAPRQLPDPDEYIQAEREEALRREEALLYLGQDGSGAESPVPVVEGADVCDPSLKERNNMASSKMGAKVVVANPEATRVGEVLKDDPDTYLKSECKSKDGQWLIIELAQVIKVEAITLSVTEMYSARLKTVQVLGHDGRLFGDAAEIAASRNSTDWRAVAVLSAENRRGLHVFMIPRRRWAKYLQFRFVEHYGNQKVCAINSIEIFGLTKAEEILKELEAVAGHSAPPGGGGAAQEPPPGGEHAAPASDPPSGSPPGARAAQPEGARGAAAGGVSGGTPPSPAARAPEPKPDAEAKASQADGKDPRPDACVDDGCQTRDGSLQQQHQGSARGAPDSAAGEPSPDTTEAPSAKPEGGGAKAHQAVPPPADTTTGADPAHGYSEAAPAEDEVLRPPEPPAAPAAASGAGEPPPAEDPPGDGGSDGGVPAGAGTSPPVEGGTYGGEGLASGDGQPVRGEELAMDSRMADPEIESLPVVRPVNHTTMHLVEGAAATRAQIVSDMNDYTSRLTAFDLTGPSAVIDMFFHELKALKLDQLYNKKYMKDAVANITLGFAEHDEQVTSIEDEVATLRSNAKASTSTINARLEQLSAQEKHLRRGLEEASARVAELSDTVRSLQQQQAALLAAGLLLVVLRRPSPGATDAPSPRAAVGWRKAAAAGATGLAALLIAVLVLCPEGLEGAARTALRRILS